MFTAADGYPVRRQGGTAHIPESGLIFVCVGCCCGHAERGGPKTPPRTLKREMRRAFRDSGMQGRLRLAFTDCLGPCSEANVVFLYLAGRPLWLRRVNNVDVFRRALDWARAALDDGGDRSLPPPLATLSFAWTGGGEGPAPPIDR
ncbi:MAG TPA: (2Fe-2S) ferredoxin domain-containing protein [Methylomirabilota bacterium]|nr:(2Fe-2S) ferredoxin domain-containing protein [Methylomirabilota bacterium]